MNLAIMVLHKRLVKSSHIPPKFKLGMPDYFTLRFVSLANFHHCFSLIFNSDYEGVTFHFANLCAPFATSFLNTLAKPSSSSFPICIHEAQGELL
jgi:hypothetical protein